MILRAQRAREQRHPHAEWRAQLVDREEVLLCERLGRGHERALPAGLDAAQERVERDDGLPRSHVALQETLHRHGTIEVAVDLLHRPHLIRGEPERKRLPVVGDELAGGAETLRRRRLTRHGRAQEREAEDEQLVEREPRSAGLGLRKRARSVDRREGVGA